MPREKSVRILVSDDEHRALKVLCAEAGITMSMLLRAVIKDVTANGTAAPLGEKPAP